MNRLRITPQEQTLLISEATQKIKTANTISSLGDLAKLLKPINEKEIIKPTIYITNDAMTKMQYLVQESDVEISWHGLVKRNLEKNQYLIYDILLFPQINTASATNTEQEKYAQWLQEIMLDPNESKFDDMRMHGHSHVNMGVFSSGIDDGYQKDLIKNIKDDDYYIFIIMNKRNEICILLYDYKQQILFNEKEITLAVISNDKIDLNTWAKAQIEKYCRKPPIHTGNRLGRAAYSIEKTKPNAKALNKEKKKISHDFDLYMDENLPDQINWRDYIGG